VKNLENMKGNMKTWIPLPPPARKSQSSPGKEKLNWKENSAFSENASLRPKICAPENPK
jgi:hypothetical protein